MKIIKNTKGITLMEVMATVAILGIVVALVTNMAVSAFRENQSVVDKVEVQTSVAALMNKFDDTIKEASIPIANDDFSGNTITIFKPSGQVKFTYNPTTDIVTCVERDSENNIIKTTEYKYITAINVILKSNKHGAHVYITGGEGKSEYSLDGAYFTRNTIP